MPTRYLVMTVALLLPIAPRSAVAADRVNECVAAHAEGQLLRNQGKLLAAKARFSECKAESCPALVRDECSALERGVDATLPSVVFRAIDEDGKPTSELAVSIDGSPALLKLDGKPVSLDPGRHRVRFERSDGRVRDVELVLAESERDRSVLADFRPPAESSFAVREGRGPRTVILVSAGVLALAVGSFTYFALSGRAIESDLQRCKPNCKNPDDLDRMNARYLLADVSLGVALLSIGAGGYVWAKHPAAFARGQSQHGTRLALSLQPRGATRSVGVSAFGEF